MHTYLCGICFCVTVGRFLTLANIISMLTTASFSYIKATVSLQMDSWEFLHENAKLPVSK